MPAINSRVSVDLTIELNIDGDVMAWEFPWIEVQPIIRDFHLITIHNLLLEDTVPVPKTISPGWIVESSKTVQETSSKPAKAAISKGSIMLLGDNVFDAESKVGQSS